MPPVIHGFLYALCAWKFYCLAGNVFSQPEHLCMGKKGKMKMTESVMCTGTKEERKVHTDILFRLPRNVRQIGQEKGGQKLYLEDYVVTFLKEMTRKNSMEFQFAVLLGNIIHLEKEVCVFVNGAVEAEDIELIEETRFSNETWSKIYDCVKKYFPEQEIIGWFATRPGLPICLDERFRKLHMDNFSGEHKALLLYDGLEGEELFFLAENGELIRQEGYFIYYEKNEAMQEYLIAKKNNKGIESAGEDESMKKMRQMVGKRNENKKTFSKGIAYSLGMAAMAAVFTAGVIFVKNGRLDFLSGFLGDKNAQTALSETDASQTDDIAEVSKWQEASDEKTAVEEEDAVEKVWPDVENRRTEDEEKENGAEESSQEKIEEEEENADEMNGWVNGKRDPDYSVMKEKYYYTVKKGDTLASISQKMYHGMNGIKNIKEANGIEDEDMILVGQVLVIP